MLLVFFLSGKVFKWRKWRAVEVYFIYQRVCTLPKSNSGWLAAIICLLNVSSKVSAVISQRIESPLAFVPLFQWYRCPGEIMLRAYRSVPGDVLGRSLNWECKKCAFKDILHPFSFEGMYKISRHITIVFCLMFPKKQVFIKFLMISVLRFPLHLVRPVLTLLFEVRKHPFLL
jgi:hypothetical protein